MESDSGHVRVFQYQVISGTATWTQLGQDIDGEAARDGSGRSVSLSSDGTRVAIGAPSNDAGGTNSGHVRIYEYSNNSWTKLGQDLDGEEGYDSTQANQFGLSISLSSDGSRIAIGGHNNVEGEGREDMFVFMNMVIIHGHN